MFEERHDPWFPFAKALAAYRAGRYEHAALWLERFAPKKDGVHADASGLALLAMVKHRAGHADEAQAALDNAHTIINEKFPDPSAGRLFGEHNFQDWLHAKRLCREADQVVKRSGTGTHKSP